MRSSADATTGLEPSVTRALTTIGPARGRTVTMLVHNTFLNDSRVLRSARTVTEEGFAVTVVALRDGDLPEHEVRDGFNVVRVLRQPWHLRWLRGVRRTARRRLTGASARRRARRARWAITARAAAMTDAILQRVLMPWHRYFSYFDFYQRAWEVLRSHPAAFYHAHDLNTLPLAWWAARKHRAALVYDSHELWTDRNRTPRASALGRRFVGALERLLIRRCDGVITVSESIAQELSRRYRVAPPIVVRNAPTLGSRSRQVSEPGLRARLGIDEAQRLVIHVGAITFNRGLEVVISALPILPDCHLVLLGYGRSDFIEDLMALADRLGVRDRVTLHPAVEPDAVADLASTADVGVAAIQNACLSYYFSSPNKLFEYLHAGLPVVASRFPEYERIVTEHQVGELFDPADAGDIARAIRVVLDDPARHQAMATNALRAASTYCWERESEKLRTLYGRLAAAPANA